MRDYSADPDYQVQLLINAIAVLIGIPVLAIASLAAILIFELYLAGFFLFGVAVVGFIFRRAIVESAAANAVEARRLADKIAGGRPDQDPGDWSP